MVKCGGVFDAFLVHTIGGLLIVGHRAWLVLTQIVLSSTVGVRLRLRQNWVPKTSVSCLKILHPLELAPFLSSCEGISGETRTGLSKSVYPLHQLLSSLSLGFPNPSLLILFRSLRITANHLVAKRKSPCAPNKSHRLLSYLAVKT